MHIAYVRLGEITPFNYVYFLENMDVFYKGKMGGA